MRHMRQEMMIMKRIYKQFKKYWSLLGVLGVCLLCFDSSIVFAENSGSITIHATVDKDAGNTIAIPNVEFSLYQVGYEQDGQWKLCEEYESSNITFDFEDATVQNQAAKTLNEIVKRENIKGTETITDIKGNAYFSGQGRGVYLLVQKGKTTYDGQVYQCAPSIFTVPGIGQNEKLWNVTVEPKFENETIQKPAQDIKPPVHTNTSTSIKNVKTGDNTKIGILLLLLLVSGVGLIAISRKCKNR